MRYLCKKNVLEFICGTKINRFHKDEWYIVNYQPSIDGREEYYDISINEMYSWRFPMSRFFEHFYNKQELREIEIDKVLEL